MLRKAGLIAALLDFSFAAPGVTWRLARAAYRLTMAVFGILGLGALIYAAIQPPAVGALVLAVTGVGLLFGLVLIRFWLGALVVLSRIEEQAEEIADQVAGIALNTAPVSEPDDRARVEGPR